MKEFPTITSEEPEFEVIHAGETYWLGIYAAAPMLDKPGAQLGKRARLLDGTVYSATPEQRDAVYNMAVELGNSVTGAMPHDKALLG